MAIDPKQQPIAFSTQDFVNVIDVVNGIIMTQDGIFSLIIKTGSVNFDLLSEQEQEFKIETYGGLINSLDFQLQVLIDTRKVKITNYLNYLNKQDDSKRTPGLRRQFLIYKQFVNNLIVNNEILEKRFMLVIPYRSGSFILENDPIDKKKKLLEQAVNYLFPKRNHVLKQMGNMGLKGHMMTSKEVVEYLYDVYNPKRPIKIDNFDLDKED